MAQAAGQLLVVAAGGQRFGLPSRTVREALRLPRLTPVPHAPPAMLGLANVRGTVLPVLSLAALTGRTPGAERRLIVLETGDPIALAVDAVAELLDAREAAAASVHPIDALGLAAGDLLRGRARVRTTAGGAGAERLVEAASDMVALVTFAIGHQSFAFPLDAVEEVLRVPADISAMPNGDAMVLGSIDVRGALLPLLRLSVLLALPGRALSARSRILVVRIGEQRVGLMVDAMQAIARVAPKDIDPVPVVLTRGDAEARIQAICRLGNGKLVSVLAPLHLLREDITARLMQSGSGPRAASAPAIEADEQVLLFGIGERTFGLPLAAIEQVTLLPATLARLPRSPAFVRGVMNIGGAAVAVIDQSRRFGLAAAAAKHRVLVVRIGDLVAGILVDAVFGIRRLPSSALHAAPVGDGEDTRLFDRVIVREGEPLSLILDPREMLDGVERDLLKGLAPRS